MALTSIMKNGEQGNHSFLWPGRAAITRAGAMFLMTLPVAIVLLSTITEGRGRAISRPRLLIPHAVLLRMLLLSSITSISRVRMPMGFRWEGVYVNGWGLIMLTALARWCLAAQHR